MNARPLPDHPLQYRAALQGLLPAEALTTRDRHRLVALFIDAGMSDVEIADRTRMTTYTTNRIRRDIFMQRLWARLDLVALPYELAG